MTSLRRTTAAAVLGLLAFASCASAQPYAVDQCRNFDTNAPAPTLERYMSVSSAAVQLTNNCGAGGDAATFTVRVPGGSVPIGTNTFVRLAIPSDRPHLRIGQVWSWYGAGKSTTNPANVTLQADGKAISQQWPAGTPIEDRLAIGGGGARALAWNLYCGGGGGVCAFADGVVMLVLKNRIFLDENVAPAVVVTGGSLVDGSDQRGVQTIAFHAGDEDSGVVSVAVRLGDTEVGRVDYECNAGDWSPCERARPDQTLSVDTTKVADGPHPLRLVATDVAQNVFTVAQGIVVVANSAARSPVTPPGPNGSNPSRDARLTVKWSGTRSRSKRIGFTASPTIRGRLSDEKGAAIAGAAVVVSARLRRAGAARQRVAGVRTDDGGRFTYKLPSGPSRTLTFEYYASGADPKPSAARVLSAIVRASLTGNASPRSPRTGTVFRFSGRLLHLPRAGVRVDIQAYELGQWRPAASNLKTTADGTFSWTHRFKAAARGHRFRFRATVDSPIYPFAFGTSKPINVLVR